LILEWALAEAQGEGGDAAALRLLRLAGDAAKPHAPLLAAWVRCADRLGLMEEAEQVRAALEASEQQERRGVR
jgi:hypothetical protein